LNKIEAVLFDLDGVLVDTAKYHYRAWQTIANISNTYAQFTLSLNGTFKRFDNKKTKKLSASYQYDMRPWEFWILTNR
tara:strand:- start:225 stop:458 length:234 start_codon:yes stop_codon:yes gene_type:complete